MVKSAAPVIFGCSGPYLLPEEREFFSQSRPFGFILFKRNIENTRQVKALVSTLKETVFPWDPAILIDQEGGRVSRLSPPHWQAFPAVRMQRGESLEEAERRIFETYRAMAQDLKELGITVNCAPVLDLDVKGADPIMGDRTFSDNPEYVARLGHQAIRAMQDRGIIPVMKHIPGHGAALCDSHQKLPVVTLSLQELLPHFEPFAANASCPWAMTAHIVYSAIDPCHPATQSSLVIQKIIRKTIGFSGFLVSDDIGMGALSGSFMERTQKSLQAGCDGVLHGSGNLHEMGQVMAGC